MDHIRGKGSYHLAIQICESEESYFSGDPFFLFDLELCSLN